MKRRASQTRIDSFLKTEKKQKQSKEQLVLLSQAELNIANKHRSNPLPWKGQFSPQLIEALLNVFATPSTVILDPFAGSSTVALESIRRGIQKIITCDINPAAILLSRIYRFCNKSSEERKKAIQKAQKWTQTILEDGIDLSKFALIHEEKDKDLQILVKFLIIKLSNQLDKLTIRRIEKEWDNIRTLVLSLPFSKEAVLQIQIGDARNLSVADDSVDLVVTSPPYINVLNYHQQHRPGVELLEWDILKIARSEIGSNRKNRTNRFLTVIQYCLDITDALKVWIFC